MIRFCDKNVNTEHSTILKEKVILDQDIWEKARYYFSHHRYKFREHVLLPVLDEEGRVICYAYEDAEADREIRMLRELSSNPGAIQFTDVYPDYSVVRIQELNELAYIFAKYLESMGVAVETSGKWWSIFFQKTEIEAADYEYLTIYAEGIVPQSRNWTENLLRSVSVEFECIDLIYEENLKRGIIKDADMDVDALIQRLQNEKEIILYGAGRAEQDAYDFLVSHGIDICCFVWLAGDTLPDRMFGKAVLGGLDARNTYKDAIFIECRSQNSAWGFGKVDYYDYIGYRRNERFFLLKDYMDIPQNNLIHIFRNKKVALIGNVRLCCCLADYFRKQNVSVTGYLNVFGESHRGLSEIDVQNIDSETVCIIAVPEKFAVGYEKKWKENKKRIEIYLKENKRGDYTDYFSHISSFINIELCRETKHVGEYLMPGRIVLGAIAGSCGNTLFRGILDGHPSVMMMDYDYSMSKLDMLHDNLFWICVCLSVEKASDILSVFWDMYMTEYCKESWLIYDQQAFDKKMGELLSRGEYFTSRELFVMFHIALMYVYGCDIVETDMRSRIIYWEPHLVPRDILEKCGKWLQGGGIAPCSLIYLVRDNSIRNGSTIKYLILNSGRLGLKAAYESLLEDKISKDEHGDCESLVVRFEDLKCEPRRTLTDLFVRWGIPWCESCMETTAHGKRISYDNGERQISDFDIKPVFDRHEQYVSEFDRLRIIIATRLWQQDYGYPYVDITEFSRRELQEMFIKKFRFEKWIKCENLDINIRIEIQKWIRTILWQARMLAFHNDAGGEMNDTRHMLQKPL